MKVVKFRIQNYKSILDSGDISLDDKIITLAGKNESGKTAILLAIADLNIDKKIDESALPIGADDPILRLSITFEFDAEEINEIFKEAGVKTSFSSKTQHTFFKTYPNKYELGSNALQIIEQTITSIRKNYISHIDRLNKRLLHVQAKNPDHSITLSSELIQNDNLTIENDKKVAQMLEVIQQIKDEQDKQEINKALEYLQTRKFDFESIDQIETKLIEKFKTFIPNFIYFDSFENLLPYSLKLSEIANNKPVLNYIQIAGIDLSKINDNESSAQSKTNYLKRRSTVIEGEFMGYWEQDIITLQPSLQGKDLVFGFFEEGKVEVFSMEQRSKGFQWYLSFYIQLKAQAKEGRTNILLLDEPGQHLHAKAQKEVLKFLEAEIENIVIFTTHSPYLIDPKRLDRVKLVLKTKSKGTIVSTDLPSVTDSETLTPILTAIGTELTSGIQNVDKKNNVIIEGASDWFYFETFKKLLGQKQLNFIYAKGAGNMGNVGTILRGWDCEVVFIFDNDQGKKDGEKNLTKKWLFEKLKVKSVSDEASTTIEDLFDPRDFHKFVSLDTNVNVKISNSDYVKTKKLRKTLLAKAFKDNPPALSEFSKVTIYNFTHVLKILSQEFSEN